MMTPGQPLVFHWRGLPFKRPPNYRGLFLRSRLPGSRWEGKYWNILSAKEQTYWESVGRLLTAAFDSAREKARREQLGVVDVDFHIPPYDEAVPLVVPSPLPLPPARAQRVRPYRRRPRAGSAPPQTPSAPRARDYTLPQLEAVPEVVMPQSDDVVRSSPTQAPPLQLTFKVQKQPSQPGKNKEEVEVWLASQVPVYKFDIELERRRLRRRQEQCQAKKQAQAEGSGVDMGKKPWERLLQQGKEHEQAEAQSPKECDVHQQVRRRVDGI
ncbi:hypothetical protein BDZ89DRAFT_1159898 [Hymenopellis radicata]|nr:hypothetical protein BDZ89DRAFT_1159898 [Hymenopellis radicata]